MQQWDLTALYISFTIEGESGRKGVTWFSGNWSEWEGFDRAEELASEGWELVSVVPSISGFFAEQYHTGMGGCSTTSGLYMFFKRPR